MAINRRTVPDQARKGTFGLFIYRAWGQNSQQATVELPRTKPLLIPRTGTSAPIGAPTMVQKKRGI